MIDSHCHLTMISKEKSEIIKVVGKARDNGIYYIVDVGVHPSDLDERFNLLGDLDNVYMTAGFYPDYAYSYKPDEVDAFKDKVISMNKDKRNIYMIGEFGLDYYHNSEDIYKQIELFERLIALSNELALPISIHTREAFADTIEVLSKNRADKLGIIHCFSGGLEEAKKLLDLGFLISFSGVVTYPKNQDLRDVAKYVPDDMFCIETDAPYLSPQKVRSKKNEPSFLVHTATAVGNERSVSFERVLELNYRNVSRLLNI